MPALPTGLPKTVAKKQARPPGGRPPKVVPGTGPAAGVNRGPGAMFLSCHPQYDMALCRWQLVRDVICGSEEIKRQGTKYLPSLQSQDAEDYDRYKKRAIFFNAPLRTRDALVGLLMRKSPAIKLPDNMNPWTRDIDLTGKTLNDYVRRLGEELLSVGRGGSVVDWDANENRPFVNFYEAEDVRNWDWSRNSGRMLLSTLTLRDRSTRLNSDTLVHETIDNYRIYRLVDGAVTVESYFDEKGNEAVPGTRIELTRRGKPLDFIPFVFHGLNSNSADIGPAPLEIMCEIAISHYCTSADLENGRHFAGLPTPYAFGAFDPKQKLVMGTSHAWMCPDPLTKVGFLEFTGAGLSELRLALIEKQGQMAILGARMIEPEKQQAEAYGTVKMRADAEQATLVNVAEVISAAMSQILQMMAWWDGAADKFTDLADTVSFTMSTDFMTGKVDSLTLTAWVAAHQMGSLSYPSLFYNMQQGEMYPDGWTLEKEQDAITTGPLMAIPAPPTEIGGPPNPVPKPVPAVLPTPPATKTAAKKVPAKAATKLAAKKAPAKKVALAGV